MRLEISSLLNWQHGFCSFSLLFRPTDEEAEQLLQLMTSRPPATPAGVRFVSLSFCMLLAFSTLVRYLSMKEELCKDVAVSALLRQ